MNRKDRRSGKSSGPGPGQQSPQIQQALQHHQSGQLAMAETIYRRILAQNGRDTDALYLLGVLLAQKGAFAEAERLLSAATQLRLIFPDAWFNLGNVHLQAQRLEQAESAYRQTLSQQPNHLGALWNLGNLLIARHDLEAGRQTFARMLSLDSASLEAKHGLALALCGLRQYAQAETLIRQVLAKRPVAQSRALLGQILFYLDRLEEAEEILKAAIPELPGLLDPLLVYANIQRRFGRLDAARRELEALAAKFPQEAMTRLNLAMCLMALGLKDKALPEADRALELSPGDEVIRYNRCLLYLQAGRLREAWADFGLRFSQPGHPPRLELPFPFLSPDDRLEEQSVLIWPEQGIGDQLTFSSAYADLIERAKAVEILTYPKLDGLLRRSFPQARIILHPRESQATCHLAAGDLFALFRNRIEEFPNRPYLRADEARMSEFRQRLEAMGPGLKIGIGWRSTKVSTERLLHFFSDLMPWGPILKTPGVTFINLQPKAEPLELAAASKTFGCRIETFDDVDLFDDLDRTAALMGALDLVISNGSANAILAGAIGLPVWMFYYADAHWNRLGTDRIPWVPSLVTVERFWNEGWEGPIQRIADALQESLATGRLTAPKTHPRRAE